VPILNRMRKSVQRKRDWQIARPPSGLEFCSRSPRFLAISGSIPLAGRNLIKERLWVTTGALVLATVFAFAQTGRTIQVDITYTGSGTVNASHKIYVALWDSADFSSGPPVAVKSLDSKNGIVTFTDVPKVPAYVSAAYDPTENGMLSHHRRPALPLEYTALILRRPLPLTSGQERRPRSKFLSMIRSKSPKPDQVQVPSPMFRHIITGSEF
jgi:hypothetical protein